MSFVVAAPEALVTAASDLAGIGSTLGSAGAAAAAPTTGVLAAAADQVSEQVAALLSEHGLGYQQLSAQLAAFHEQFVQTLSAGAGAFAAAEADAAQALASPGAAGAAVAQSIGAGGAVSNAVGRIESFAAGAGFPGAGFPGAAGVLGGVTQEIGAASQAGALLLRPTGGLGVLTAARALLAPAAMTNAAVAPAASGGIGGAIEAAYLAIEPWVQYGFNLAAYAVSFLPYVGFLYPQIYFFYDLFEPIVQSGLFNTIDWLQGTITFGQGLANFGAATTASINQFINSEINWALGFLPPLPPLPPIFP